MSSPTPDRVEGEVLGFRQWKVDDDLSLRSAHIADHWTPGDNHATCQTEDRLSLRYPHLADELRPVLRHPAPQPDCHCGFYALHAPTFWYGDGGSQNSPWGRLNQAPSPEYVAGLVTAWGRVEVHRDGFRAANARVVAIAIPTGKRAAAIARAVAAEYKVAAVPQDRLEELAPEFGATIPADLRPKRESMSYDEYHHWALNTFLPKRKGGLR